MKHFRSDFVIFGCTPLACLVYFHIVVALFQLYSRERSNGFLSLTSLDVKNVIRKDVRFTLKGSECNNRYHSLSNSHAMIAFENNFDILTAITISIDL